MVAKRSRFNALKIAGTTVFVTGGANGIGLGIARSLARQGAKLALVDLDSAALERAKAELSTYTTVEIYPFDVRDREAFARVADDAERALGPVSLLFNNAGIVGGAPVHRMTYELWDWGLGINLNGVVNGVQTFVPRMIDRGLGGQIVNTSSVAGLVTDTSGVLYHTAKFAVVGLTEALRLELEPLGIGVTLACPGPVATDIVTRTRMLQPRRKVAVAGIDRALGIRRAEEAKAWLATGLSPDVAGEMIVAGAKSNQAYVHTDSSFRPNIEARMRTILDSIPVEDGDGDFGP